MFKTKPKKLPSSCPNEKAEKLLLKTTMLKSEFCSEFVTCAAKEKAKRGKAL